MDRPGRKQGARWTPLVLLLLFGTPAELLSIGGVAPPDAGHVCASESCGCAGAHQHGAPGVQSHKRCSAGTCSLSGPAEPREKRSSERSIQVPPLRPGVLPGGRDLAPPGPAGGTCASEPAADSPRARRPPTPPPRPSGLA